MFDMQVTRLKRKTWIYIFTCNKEAAIWYPWGRKVAHEANVFVAFWKCFFSKAVIVCIIFINIWSRMGYFWSKIVSPVLLVPLWAVLQDWRPTVHEAINTPTRTPLWISNGRSLRMVIVIICGSWRWRVCPCQTPLAHWRTYISYQVAAQKTTLLFNILHWYDLCRSIESRYHGYFSVETSIIAGLTWYSRRGHFTGIYFIKVFILWVKVGVDMSCFDI